MKARIAVAASIAVGAVALATAPHSQAATPALTTAAAERVISSFQKNRASWATTRPAPTTAELKADVDPQLLATLEAEKRAIQRNQELIGGRTAYDGVRQTVTIKDVSVDGSTASVTSRDITELHIAGMDGSDDSFSGEGQNMTYTFSLSSGQWLLSGVKNVDDSTSTRLADDGSGPTAGLQGHLVDPAPLPDPAAAG